MIFTTTTMARVRTGKPCTSIALHGSVVEVWRN
jgi:hypothetical protein